MIGVLASFGLVLAVVALRANARLRFNDKLPMQWRFGGKVTWSAPRAIALAFIPTLAISTLVVVVLLSANMQPRAGQEGFVFSVFIVIGISFVAIQFLHLWLISKTLRDSGA